MPEPVDKELYEKCFKNKKYMQNNPNIVHIDLGY